MLDTSIQVKTDRFDGPLSLLLLLIQKEEMDIRSLDLTLITKQYLGYLAKMRELNFDVAGDYLFLAATLLLLKSKSCVTEEEVARLQEAEDELAITSQAELIRRLEELQRYQRLGEQLWELPKKGEDIFVKPKTNRRSIINSILTPIDTNKLTAAMMDLIRKNKRRFAVVKRDRLSIKEKLQFMKEMLQQGDNVSFEKILGEEGTDVTNVIISFISILELARLKKVTIFQNEEDWKIYVTVLDSLDNFNVELADGFDDETEAMDEELKNTIAQGTGPEATGS